MRALLGTTKEKFDCDRSDDGIPSRTDNLPGPLESRKSLRDDVGGSPRLLLILFFVRKIMEECFNQYFGVK